MAATSVFVQPNLKPSGTSFSGLQSIGLSKHLEALISANTVAATAPTVAAAVSATGGGSTGGALAAGTYYAKITEHNGIGETTGVETASFTGAAGNIPRITFQSLKSGNTARNVYLTAAGGASGTEVLYASGITAATYDLAVAAPTSTAVAPATNDGALTAFQATTIRAIASSRSFRTVEGHVNGYLHGDAISTAQAAQRITDYAISYVMIAQLLSEVATLLMANSGTLRQSTNGAGNAVTKRTFP